MSDSWYRRLFIDNAALYQPVLETGLIKAPIEVKGLIRQFNKFKVPSNGRVLDVSFGIGRHSIYLAEHGYEVVGFDPSLTFLKRAQQLARRKRLPIQHVRFYCDEIPDISTVLQSHGEGPFDAIISMDYSFGYSNRQADLKLFRSLHGLAGTRCVLVIETGNKDFWLKYYPRYFRESFTNRLERLTAFTFDRRRSTLASDWEFYRRAKGKDLKHLFTVRSKAIIYSKESLCELVEPAGWRPAKAFENIQHPKAVSDGPFLYLIAVRR